MLILLCVHGSSKLVVILTVSIQLISNILFDRWRAYFCDKTDKERQIGFLLPDHTGFMALMEKYFYQVLNKHFDSGDTRRYVIMELKYTLS